MANVGKLHGNREKLPFIEREIEKFIIRQPPKGEKDDYDSENSWISDGLPSSSRRRNGGGVEGHARTVDSGFKTVSAESGQIRKNRTFSNLRGLKLCTSHILVFGCFHGQDVVGS